MPVLTSLNRASTSSTSVIGRETYSPRETLPVCPACGSLECLCRPRFFAGQLLTDEDLNRLDHYIVEKNKLHNRFFHGYGIACGLDVVCQPCDTKSVIVKTGYALSPCGQDIIVCKDTPVNICDLVSQCRPRQEECDPLQPRPTEVCPETEQDWILGICYDERQSRGVSALRADVASVTCCNGSANSSTVSAAKQKPIQCEATQICEWYRFKVYRALKRGATESGTTRTQWDVQTGQLLYRVAQRLPSYPSRPTFDSVDTWANDLKASVWELLSEMECPDRQLQQDIQGIKFPTRTTGMSVSNYTAAVTATVQEQIVPALVRILILLLCQFLKLDCPAPVEQDCVPLARIRVHVPDCRVVSICSVGAREYALSALVERLYSFLRPLLPTALGLFCCQREKTRLSAKRVVTIDPKLQTLQVQALQGGGNVVAKDLRAHLEQSIANPGRTVDVEALAHAMLGATYTRAPVLTPEELATPLSLLLENQFLKPVLTTILPESWSSALEGVSKLGTKEVKTTADAVGTRGTAEGLASLRTSVGSLQETIKKQNVRIQKLEAKLQNR